MGEHNYNLERLNILVIDDNSHMRHIVKTVLNTLGVKKIREADNGADAMREMRHFLADIVICDWHMEPINGIEFTKLVRCASDSPNHFVPIIMLSSHTQAERVIEARDSGVHEFLAKPISAKSLYLRICMIIDHARPFIQTPIYFGPCRRRKDIPRDITMERRMMVPVEIAYQQQDQISKTLTC
jgi:PleD family two-component response regulator